jgi:hypothetical protein
LRAIGLDRLLGPAHNRCRDLVIAMIVAADRANLQTGHCPKPFDGSTGQSDRLAIVRFFDPAAIPIALPQQDGGRRVSVRGRPPIYLAPQSR